MRHVKPREAESRLKSHSRLDLESGLEPWSQGGRDKESGRGNIMYTRLEDRATGTKRVSRSVAVRGET